jgi:hypothetical protein
MHKPHRTFALATLSVALVSLLVYAGSGPTLQQVETVERNSPDLMPDATRQRLSLTASQATTPMAAAGKSAPTVAEVGDVDSFGRNLKWLGVTQMNLTLADTCPPPADNPGCVELNAAPASTSFTFEDLARITLPKKAAHSLLCYWFSPFLNVRYANPTAIPATARLTFSPTLTVENPVLDDPALINPMTGLPFGGRLLTGMTSAEHFEVLLDPGQQLFERTRDSAVCIAGFISKRALVSSFGLTESQAKEFFKQPTTVRMNITGNAHYVQSGSLVFGFRIIGD